MPASLYIHIPYCKSKCPYCDFASVPLDANVGAYLRSLLKEAAHYSGVLEPVKTVYIGGGTPTVLTLYQISRLFEGLREIFPFSPHAEITVEANPCSLNEEKAQALADNGVNRVSLGAQSFIETELRVLGRRHDTRDIVRALTMVREAGINNVNIDLIYGIPEQSVARWRQSLAQAIELQPEHISAYCLTFEQRTPFWRLLQEGKIKKKPDDEELEFFETARHMLEQAGYEHYEISNFALAGKRSMHNTIYWLNEEYLGLGAGAVSYISGRRICNLREPEEYIGAMESRGNAACEIDEISPHMQAVETIIQQLRLREGIDCRIFTERFGVHPEEILNSSLPELIGLDMLEQTSDVIRARPKGWHLANEVALKILP